MSLIQSKFHFVGVGGVGMSALAELLHNMGAKVSGSDQKQNKLTDHLVKTGIEIFIGHREENIGNCDVLVYSSAVKENNPEMIAAKSKKIPRIRRAEALAEIMRLKRNIAVGGTHGKTTTTSLIATILIHSGKEPTIAVGGRLDLIKSTAKLGKGSWLVAEADESDGSFSLLSPEICIITNIDDDHLDHYGTFKELKNAFYNFASRIPFYGTAIVYGDDPKVRELFRDFPKRIIYYGFSRDNEFVITKNSEGVFLVKEGDTLGKINSILPGEHNLLNSSAAIIASHLAGVSWEDGFRGLEKFSGVDRRFHFKGEKNGVLVYDDYGHHPTEVKATLQAFKEKFKDKKIKVVFQPHRYSRTESCWLDFINCFFGIEKLYLVDIYPAGEAERPGINSKILSSQIKNCKSQYVGAISEAEKIIFPELSSGDVFLTLGAGNIYQMGENYLKNEF